MPRHRHAEQEHRLSSEDEREHGKGAHQGNHATGRCCQPDPGGCAARSKQGPGSIEHFQFRWDHLTALKMRKTKGEEGMIRSNRTGTRTEERSVGKEG